MIWLDGELEIGPTLPAAPPPAPRRIAGNELETLRRPTVVVAAVVQAESAGESKQHRCTHKYSCLNILKI